MTSNRPTDRCVYCGSTASLTRDHAPPKALFANPLPSDLYSVPACRECNKSYERDDEYFAQVLLCRDDLASHPAVVRSLQKVHRAWRRAEGAGLRRRIQQSITTVPIFDANGIRVNEASAMRIENERVERTLIRVVRALANRELGGPLPTGVHLRADIDYHKSADQHKHALNVLRDAPIHELADGMFRYSVWLDEHDVGTGVWLLEFFGRVPFLVISAGPDLRATDVQQRST